jgi:ATP-dependent DNA helicase PIF1
MHHPSLTFKDEATRLGLFDPDLEMQHALQYLIDPDRSHQEWTSAQASEQVHTRHCTAEELQRLFVTFMLTYPTNVVTCFDLFWPYLLVNPPENAFQRFDAATLRSSTSRLLATLLEPHRVTPEEFGLPPCGASEADFAEIERNRYDVDQLQEAEHVIQTLSEEQQGFINSTIDAIESGSPCLYYLRGPAGCGKTATITALIATLRRRRFIVVPSAFMATNAAMFDGGDTCHRIFGLPLLQEYSLQDPTPESRITDAMRLGKILIAASLIIIDEISMLQGCFLHCIEELLRKLMKSSIPFGGKSIIVTGDLKQVCPVQPGANRHQLIAMSCVSTSLWASFTPKPLTRQFRTSHAEFTSWASKLGYGIGDDDTVHDGPWQVTFPSWIQCCDGSSTAINNIMDETFGQIFTDPMAMANNQIICFTHETANQHNNYLSARAATEMNASIVSLRAVNAAVKVTSDIASAMATPEFIDAVDLHSLPPTNLKLFVGCIVALHRNIDKTRGLTNGAKVIICKISTYLLRVKVVSTGVEADIPRMKLSAKASNGIEFERLQFPVKLAYAITSNRSQGQTFTNKVIIDCRSPSFAHGQLYVACTRATNPNNIIILGAPTRQAIAVTYQELITLSHDIYQPTPHNTIARASSPAFSLPPDNGQQPPHPPELDDFSDVSSLSSMDED